MKIKELKELLNQYDENYCVVVDGYEGGYDDLLKNGIYTIDIVRNVNSESFYGNHDIPPRNCDKKKETVLLLSRPHK